ncbi:MAG: TatD family hydrolase, partial [Saprospiraceae bacterium]|nr:TatD family hydrolase [Saprospiraceae bacterium]
LKNIRQNKAYCRYGSGKLFSMIWFTSCRWDSQFFESLEKMKAELESGYTYYGIGETGIDLHWDKTTLEWQLESLRIQCSWAYEFNLPIILHTRNANEVVIDLMENIENRPSRGIFHCFSGTRDEINRIDTLGDFYYGIGGVISYKNAGLFEAIPYLPLDKIVLETDAPYLAPVPHRGKRNESAYIIHVLERLAQAVRLSIEDVESITTANAERLFGTDQSLSQPHTIIG